MYKKNDAFSLDHFGQFLFFSLVVIFSKFLDGIKEKASDKLANFHKFEHLSAYQTSSMELH